VTRRLFVDTGATLIFRRKSMEREDQDENYIYSSRKDKAEGNVIEGKSCTYKFLHVVNITPIQYEQNGT